MLPNTNEFLTILGYTSNAFRYNCKPLLGDKLLGNSFSGFEGVEEPVV